MTSDPSGGGNPPTPETARFVHDLRNGLASVRAAASMLTHAGTNPSIVAKVAEGLQEQVRLMVELVDAFVGKSPATTAVTPGESPPPSSSTPAPASRRSVLVADDNADAASALARFLRLEDYRVNVAFDGEQALALAAADPPDVMLLDIGMPTRDGYELARTVRSQPWGADVQLIAISGWFSPEDRERASLAGFNAHLSKPIDMDQLQRLLR